MLVGRAVAVRGWHILAVAEAGPRGELEEEKAVGVCIYIYILILRT